MGLDMYLEARRYLFSFKEADQRRASQIGEMFPEVNFGEVKEVKVELAYWRKANAIHKWFVDNIQKGNDDCGSYEVTRDDLLHLRNILEELLKDRTIELAKQMMPPQSGFFFGDTEIDDYYWEDLEFTLERVNKILDTNLDDWDIYYQSSW